MFVLATLQQPGLRAVGLADGVDVCPPPRTLLPLLKLDMNASAD